MLTAMSALRLYTDGSCPTPGAAGGWAWIVVRGDAVTSASGPIPAPTNHQKAELIAAIEGVAYVVTSGVSEVELLSDSRYVIGGLSSNGRTGWAHASAEREWRNARGKPLKNPDLWERLLELEGCLAVTCRHVPGHRPKKDTSDDAHYNREVDVLAVQARKGLGFVVPGALS
jgi:ribonuclease HI